MWQIVGALFIFFYIVVPIVNLLLSPSPIYYRTEEQKKHDKKMAEIKELEELINSNQRKFKRGYIITGLTSLYVAFCGWTSPYVDKMVYTIWVFIGAGIVMLLINYMYKYTTKTQLEKYNNLIKS